MVTGILKIYWTSCAPEGHLEDQHTRSTFDRNLSEKLSMVSCEYFHDQQRFANRDYFLTHPFPIKIISLIVGSGLGMLRKDKSTPVNFRVSVSCPNCFLDGRTTWGSWDKPGCDRELRYELFPELGVFLVVTTRRCNRLWFRPCGVRWTSHAPRMTVIWHGGFTLSSPWGESPRGCTMTVLSAIRHSYRTLRAKQRLSNKACQTKAGRVTVWDSFYISFICNSARVIKLFFTTKFSSNFWKV